MRFVNASVNGPTKGCKQNAQQSVAGSQSNIDKRMKTNKNIHNISDTQNCTKARSLRSELFCHVRTMHTIRHSTVAPVVDGWSTAVKKVLLGSFNGVRQRRRPPKKWAQHARNQGVRRPPRDCVRTPKITDDNRETDLPLSNTVQERPCENYRSTAYLHTFQQL